MKNKIFTFLVMALVVIGFATFFAVDRSEASLSLGVISGMTGEYGEIGQNYVNGIRLAYDEYLKEHEDSQIKIIVEDDAFDSKKGLSAFKKLTEFEKVDALMNMTTPTIEVIYDEVARLNLPVIQLGVQSREPEDDSVFQITGDGVSSKEALGLFVGKKYDGDTVIVYQQMAAIINFVESFKKGFSGDLQEVQISVDEEDFRSIATKVLSKKPDNVVIIMFPEQGARFTKEIISQSKDDLNLVYDSQLQTGFGDYKRILGDLSFIDGAYVEYILESKDNNFIADYFEKYGVEPGLGADWGYDSFNLLVENYDRDEVGWIENIKKTEREGASGKMSFDVRGVRQIETEVRQIVGGEFLEI